MNSALPAFTLGICLTILCSFSVSAQSATPPASAPATAAGVDGVAAKIRTAAPFVKSAPTRNGIPFEYRLAAIRGPKAERIIDEFIKDGFSNYGSLFLTQKEQLPAKLRNESGNTCSVCKIEETQGTTRDLEYYVFWLRSLSPKQHKQLVAVLEK